VSSTERRKEMTFVLTLPRSGSTLLRYLLDSHSEICCPPETQLSSLCASVMQSWLGFRSPDDFEVRKKRALAHARAAARRLADWHLNRDAKSFFCEKSLPNVDHALLLSEVFPHARFICLYRHPMDFIASALDSCKWGFGSYGLYPYLAGTVNNFVFGLARAWCERTSMICAVEDHIPERCMRLKYEDLVTGPEKEFGRVCDFLGVDFEPFAVSFGLRTEHLVGHGDHKIRLTEEVSTESLGRGSSVPVGLIPPIGLTNMNEISAALGYESVGGDFNGVPSQLRRGLLTEDDAVALRRHLGPVLQHVVRQGDGVLGMKSMRLLIEEFTEPGGWTLDFAERALRHDDQGKLPTVALIMRARTLLVMCEGLMDLARAVDHGDVRIGKCERPEDAAEAARWLASELGQLDGSLSSFLSEKRFPAGLLKARYHEALPPFVNDVDDLESLSAREVLSPDGPANEEA
jgi:protein-tyrosine sulfotransferase